MRKRQLVPLVADINRRLEPDVDPALDDETKRLYAAMPPGALRVLRVAFTADRDQGHDRPSLVAFAQIRIDYITQLLGEPPEGPR